MRLTIKHVFWVKAAIHFVSLIFFADLVWRVLSESFGADPVEGITHYTGIAALNTLILTLIISPLAKVTKQGMLVRCRRMVGLYAFFWATLHMLTYFSLDLGFNIALLGSEIVKRPYLTVGATCWLILFALTVTSTSRIQRSMGAKWQKLHNSVYIALILAPIHFYWSSKSELIEPAIYFALAISLLLIRWKTLKRIVFRPVIRRS
ncbi:protein-methionine-sulfoxide reductase heme-binding subunit MsrQ [Enterovibrio sp. ZSDZ35]|uniref:Protein-methionine-sulfoxide reductase heme-binding subunit MsrQ n=1 Tax=Enterovibrio qingdaonensis TaxID=2899818 RepID=A0ABT5QFH7_9GAMM|nr:protein-methionine-sulfoxide reductase heme-binding subunit MsrQ [Enterovibrio sp. ZSDZ35]MDD1779732.1 protein-methionine-sulfoxide reductase heme-binding subunit MsrQ [Enterovibrio sp. ZSDZ35]